MSPRIASLASLASLALLALLAVAACPAPAPESPRPADQTLSMIEASQDLDGAIVGTSANPTATIVIVFASWCGHCKRELDVIGGVRRAHPGTRILGINYRGHEEYDGRGNAQALRAYVASSAPWLRVVPADEPLFVALGRPPMVPTIIVYGADGRIAARYDRRDRAMPDASELDELLRGLGR